jgi:hypothetical protein
MDAWTARMRGWARDRIATELLLGAAAPLREKLALVTGVDRLW